MISKLKLTVIAPVAALSIAAPAMAQSAYTTGTESNRVAADYPSPYAD